MVIRMKSPKTLNNKNQDTVYDELKKYIKFNSRLSVISGYFSIYAYHELKEKLDNIDNMRFIFTEPSFIKNKSNTETREYEINKTEKGIFGNEYELKLKNEMTQSAVTRECAEWIEKKVEVKSYIKSNLATTRMIHVENLSDEDNISITGTVDFTSDGLGITSSDRQDMNICMYGRQFTDGQLDEFNKNWNDNQLVEDVKDKFLKHMQIMYAENTPEYLYYVTMYNLFNDYLRESGEDTLPKTGTGFKDKQIWKKLYKFQKDAVMGAIDKIEKYNGCIIADSVGLGKTFTALAIIKYYELRNLRVLVLVPKKLRDNWTIYTKNDKRNIFIEDRFSYDVLNHSDLSRYQGKSGDIDLKTVNWENYDLVVIDESHNFRNNPARKDRKTRYQRFMEDVIKSGVKTKILMLSATPVNNRMRDINNQIAFITEEHDDALTNVGIDSIETTLNNAQKIFNQWTKLPVEERTTSNFIDSVNMDYFKLLDTLTIARSRKHILKYYDNSEIGEFPKKLEPINVRSHIDTQEEFPSIKEIDAIINNLNMSAYAPVKYILSTKIDEYVDMLEQEVKDGSSKFKQIDRDINIVHLIRTNMLKRLESSISSFIKTVAKILNKVNYCLKLTEKGNYTDKIDMDLIDPESEEYDRYMFGRDKVIKLKDMDLIKWKQDLELDKKQLKGLLEEAKKITVDRDQKLQNLKEIITQKINNPINLDNKKIILFTTYADTAEYLYENLHLWLQKEYGLHSALVTGGNKNKTTMKKVSAKDINDILLNFSPKSKERYKIEPEQKEEIDVLIATDCISEGQNLQDCDYLINYDIHWNPVRIIQRFGRIDRIGSNNKQIQLVNFWPDIDLDEYINLKERVENRMVIVDVSSTGDENIIKSQKIKELEYRKKQLQQLQEQVIELEDVNGGISITDLTFNDFKIELTEYKEEHEKELMKSPPGIYSIIKIPSELKEELKPGVIFLLKETMTHNEENPLNPYYLVYITEEKTVKYNYIQSKKIMDYYKKLCYRQTEVFQDLVKEFNKETKNGIKMDKYSELLRLAIENTKGQQEEIGIKSIFSKGGITLTKKQATGLEEYELITFLILR